jgi:hypothetical protein
MGAGGDKVGDGDGVVGAPVCEPGAGVELGGLAQLRRVDPPPSLVAGVMRRVAEPQPPSLWRWLRRPVVIELRVSRFGVATAGLAVALGIALLVAPRPVGPAAVPASGGAAGAGAAVAGAAAASTAVAEAAAAERPVLVRLRLQAKGARRVAVAGSFNEWSADRTWLAPASEADVFVVTLALPPGTHEYMFVVDGRWMTDPAAEERRPDGFGRQNALLRL